jgi:hypothetical protein
MRSVGLIRPSRPVVDYPADSDDLHAYLRGETLPSPGEEGWTLVTVAGFPLGWGKRVAGRLKSHYPKGLRWTSTAKENVGAGSPCPLK